MLIASKMLDYIFLGAEQNFDNHSREKYHTLLGETLSGETSVGRNYSSGEIFVTKRKIRHFRPTKSFAQ